MTKVISFSVYGRNPWYTIGAIRNAQLAKRVYPGWMCRFYHDATVPEDIIRRLSQFENVELIQMDDVSDPRSTGFEHRGAFWRFYVAADPEVERWIARDADSRLNWREKACVDQWIESGKPFHIMREAQHKRWPINVGMCGGIGGMFPDIENEIDSFIYSAQPLWRKLLRRYRIPKNTDCRFFAEIIWPRVREDHLAHDANSRRLLESDLPFPPHRPLDAGMGEYVGQVLDEDEQPLHKPDFPPELRGYDDTYTQHSPIRALIRKLVSKSFGKS